MSDKTIQIIVTGLVQGVGFRPFVYRLAARHDLNGWVLNTNENVQICISGQSPDIEHFLTALEEEAPTASRIEDVIVTQREQETFTNFEIRHSHDVSDEITEISPDIAVCSECMADIEKDGTRLNYAFVNCTNCGPRFTIIQDLPYDRAKTTMRSFSLCSDCRKEYESIADRRFHAQPTACSRCGPSYELFINGKTVSENMDFILHHVAGCIDDGGIALIKGLGGMHLACDAFNETAVEKLRGVKKRDGKPFAVMFRDLETLMQYAQIDKQEEESLLSWRRPIVLLELKPGRTRGIAESVNANLNLLGVMLPYMPVHYLLFRQMKTTAVVLTSGNFSTEPILIDNKEAISRFSSHLDALLLHNREIFNRTDDSVVRIIGGKERVFRRSRGYVPTPVRTGLNTDGILSFGAELTNCFCIGKGKKAYLSQHIGHLQGLETTLFYEQTIARFLKLFRVTPALLAADMHPDYTSTKTAQQFHGITLVQVQHHHAHIASCMAEHRLDEMVIGVALDGTGYGDDGNIWGSEFMVCDFNDYTRVTHFEYLPLPGGDMAAEEPWRMAVSWLYHVFGHDFVNLGLAFLNDIEPEKTEILIQMIRQQINCPLTSGAGRLFDAVSSLLGLCQVASFQSEGPMRLESLVQENCSESYPFKIGQTVLFDNTLRGIVDDIKHGIDPGIIASKFHNTIITVIFETVNVIRKETGIRKVVLSGGVFQNKYLLENTVTVLRKYNFEVFSHASIPTNDGGIALGQLAIASKRRSLKCV